MARGTTAIETATGTQIITQALYELGEYGPYDTIPTEELLDLLVVLVWMIKLWQGQPDIDTSGLKMWQRTEGSLDLGTAGAAISYTIQTGGKLDVLTPVAIKSVTYRDANNQEIVLTPFTMEEYQAIPDKTQTGTPKQYYWERGYSGSTLYLDIIPSVVASCYLDIVYLRPLYSLSSIGQEVDFPDHWYMALYLNLAKFIAPRYNAKVKQLTLDNAKYTLQKAQKFYPEDVNVSFEPGRDD